MDIFEHPLLLATISCIILSSLVIISSKLINQTHKNNLTHPPECSGAWPIVGHLPLLGGSTVLHRALAGLARAHGPIFAIRLGVARAVVVSSVEVARECLLVNDRAVLGRLKTVAGELLCYDNALFGLGPYGPYWRHVRKIVMVEMLSNYRLNVLSRVWKYEIRVFVKDLYEKWGSNANQGKLVVDLKQRFRDLAMNIIVKIVCGKKFGVDSEEGLGFHEAIREFLEHIGTFAVGDALPFLRWLDLGGQEKAMRRNFKKLDGILQKWLDEHKQNKSKDDHDDDDEKDFMDVMFDVDDDHEAVKDSSYDADTINKATCLNMIAGGGDTTPITMIWAIALLVNNPRVLERAQDELTTQIGKDRQVDESDLPHLVYLQAIVKETLRLYPAAPLLVREFIEDCKIGGYHIETGTRLLVNLYQISRDPRVWKDPLEFRPERFLTTHKEIDVRGQNFELIPFGSGRRVCPGASFALQVVHLALANFLHAFEISTPSDEPIDMSEGFGFTCMKAKPLEVLIAPILSTKAYM